MIEIQQDYAMTYPCFLAGRGHDSLTTLDVAGERCICLFTDEDLATHYGERVNSAVTFTPLSTRDELVKKLGAIEQELRDCGILRIAFDATAGRMTRTLLIADLISALRVSRPRAHSWVAP